MSLCYDFSKWTMITLASVAISLTVGLILMQSGHGQNMTILQLGQNMTISQLGEQTEALKTSIDYCFQHADRPNPIQDLIDNGFLSPEFNGETCISIKQKYALLDSLYIEKVQKARHSALYLHCLANETIEYCDRIYELK
jgi:hypothetical protein